MKRCVSAIILLMLAPVLKAAGPTTKFEPLPFFTWGARVGFAATGTYVTDVFIDDHKLTEYTQDTQVSNFIALQFRLNSQRLFFQSGFGIGQNKSTFSMDRNALDPQAEYKNEFSLSYSMTSFMIPAQIGYHAVNRPPYTLSLFTGPRLRMIPDNYFKSTFNNIEPYILVEDPTNFIVSWTFGMSVQIGRTFLDFEYEATINNVSYGMYETTGNPSAPDFTLNRRVSMISFSYGIIF